DRATARAGARLARALLRPGLLAATTHFRAGFLRLGASTAGRAVRGVDLVHQGLVVLLAEGRFRHLELSTAADLFELHGQLLLTLLGGVLGRATARLGRRHNLALRKTRGLQTRTHDHLSTLGTRHGATDQEQVARDVDFNDAQVLGRHAVHAHVAGHATALKDAARGLTH